MKKVPDNEALPQDAPNDCSTAMERLLAIGAEPYWMADIRLAQRAIDTLRARRSQERSQRASSDESSEY